MMKNQNIIFMVILSAVGCFALLPAAQGACPSPNPGCPGFNTADGQKALFSVTSGSANTANG
jgi:hypothetical protein